MGKSDTFIHKISVQLSITSQLEESKDLQVHFRVVATETQLKLGHWSNSRFCLFGILEV